MGYERKRIGGWEMKKEIKYIMNNDFLFIGLILFLYGGMAIRWYFY